MHDFIPWNSEISAKSINDENIRGIFNNAADFNSRRLDCHGHTLYAYAIDGLTSGADTSEYVFKPIMEQLRADSMEELYQNALNGAVINSVAKECQSVKDVSLFLVNGFCVVLFPGAGALAFEVGLGQFEDVMAIMEEAGYKNLQVRCDLAGIERVVWGTWEPKE